MSLSEFALIKELQSVFPASLRQRGYQEDAAILSMSSTNGLISTDIVVDGVDFKIKNLKPELIGRKALAVNLSDMAAMGGRPKSFVIGLGLPRGVRRSWIKRVYQGMLPLVRRYQVSLAGGDLTFSPRFFVSITVFGQAVRPVLRSGAKAGHLIGVTGSLGGSLQKHHYAFEPRLQEGHFLASYASSLIDISDGFAQDLEHILQASGVAASVDGSQIPVSSAARRKAKGSKVRALKAALSDGEDFELIFTIPKQKKKAFSSAWKRRFPKTRLSWVGEIQKGRPALRFKNLDFRLAVKGYQHFYG